ncbi:MAG: hypothetical protein VX911_06050 [Candidatus Latescibacterota bacterium]|nr:hypothetical protein [Candidatus Latescibacterota bacterium]
MAEVYDALTKRVYKPAMSVHQALMLLHKVCEPNPDNSHKPAGNLHHAQSEGAGSTLRLQSGELGSRGAGGGQNSGTGQGQRRREELMEEIKNRGARTERRRR